MSVEHVLKLGFGALLGAAIVEAMDEDKTIEKGLHDIADDIRNLPKELINVVSEEISEDDGLDKVKKTIGNFRRATSPVDRFVDQCLSMNISQAKKNLQKGDHIYCNKTCYSHHGVYDGEGGVYHFVSSNDESNWRFAGESMVIHSSLEEFSDGNKINVRRYESKVPADEIISRAKSKLGKDQYNLFNNNCEHFSYWCRGYYDDEKETK